MDVVLMVLIVLAVVAVLGGLFAGRKRRQGPEPRFEGTARQGDLAEQAPTAPPDPGAEDMAAPEPGDPAPGDPRKQG